jgi:ferredoxin
MDKKRILIDHQLCSGVGECANAASHVFIVQHGKSWVRSDVAWATVAESDVEAGVASCPWFAIDLLDGRPEDSAPQNGPIPRS